MSHWGIIRTIVSIIIITRSIVPRSVFTKSSSIKLYKEDKRLLVNSDPWPPAEQKLEMPCDICSVRNCIFLFELCGNCHHFMLADNLCSS